MFIGDPLVWAFFRTRANDARTHAGLVPVAFQAGVVLRTRHRVLSSVLSIVQPRREVNTQAGAHHVCFNALTQRDITRRWW